MVVGEDAGSKAERAEALKRPILDEAAFLAFLAEHEGGGAGTLATDAETPMPQEGAAEATASGV